jgi:putative transposase
MYQRKKLTHGVRIDSKGPTIVFLTVCTDKRQPWLATEANHSTLRERWVEARAWIVGRYVLMPDHLHLFAAPGALEVSLDNRVRYWKSQFTKTIGRTEQQWQTDHWDSGSAVARGMKRNGSMCGITRFARAWWRSRRIGHSKEN